jgi:hypothetical protein
VPTFDFSGITTSVLQMLSSVVLLVLFFRLATAYIQRGWGLIVVEVAGVIAIGYFLWFNDAAVNTLKAVAGQIFNQAA